MRPMQFLAPALFQFVVRGGRLIFGSALLVATGCVQLPDDPPISEEVMEVDPLEGVDNWSFLRDQINGVEPEPPELPPVSPEDEEEAPDKPSNTSVKKNQYFNTQLALARRGISAGALDGVLGPRTVQAIRAFQRKMGLEPLGYLDEATKEALGDPENPYKEYTVTASDVGSLTPVSESWVKRSESRALNHESILELVAERGKSYQNLIQRLNPEIRWTQVGAGTKIRIPNVPYPPAERKAAKVVIDLSDRTLQAFDESGALMVHFPCSIGASATQSPAGDLSVKNIALRPNYTFDPEVFPENAEARTLTRKYIIPPGPNNPVGMAWIGLSKPGFGMHGTPVPEFIGQTQSHGCIRLANWDAEYLAKLVRVGIPVTIQP